MGLINKYANAPTRKERKEWLVDHITQMGHDPEKYEEWYAELERIKQVEKEEEFPGEILAELPTKDISPPHWKDRFLHQFGGWISDLSDKELHSCYIYIKTILKNRRSKNYKSEKKINSRMGELLNKRKKQKNKEQVDREIKEARERKLQDDKEWVAEQTARRDAIRAAGYPDGILPSNSEYIYSPASQKVVRWAEYMDEIGK